MSQNGRYVNQQAVHPAYQPAFGGHSIGWRPLSIVSYRSSRSRAATVTSRAGRPGRHEWRPCSNADYLHARHVIIRIGVEDSVQLFTLHVKDEHSAHVVGPGACGDGRPSWWRRAERTARCAGRAARRSEEAVKASSTISMHLTVQAWA